VVTAQPPPKKNTVKISPDQKFHYQKNDQNQKKRKENEKCQL